MSEGKVKQARRSTSGVTYVTLELQALNKPCEMFLDEAMGLIDIVRVTL